MQMLHGSIASKAIVQPQHRRILGTTARKRYRNGSNRKKTKMAYASNTDLTQARADHHGLAGKVRMIAEDLSQRYARYRVFRDTVNDLAILPNSVLADMGLNRSQIRSVAYQHAYGSAE